jgi:23S rRNA pseudouridine1911/1915/1917 synthase
MIMIGAPSRVAERKVVLVPEGLNGERVDAAVARMLGLSRSQVVELIGAGRVLVDGAIDHEVGSGQRWSMLEVELADQPAPQRTAGAGRRSCHRL